MTTPPGSLIAAPPNEEESEVERVLLIQRDDWMERAHRLERELDALVFAVQARLRCSVPGCSCEDVLRKVVAAAKETVEG